MPHFRTRIATVLATVGALLGGLLVTGGAGPEAAAATVPAHPYSDPVWFPIHAKAYLDCVVSNPGCDDGTHNGWTMDFVQETLPSPEPHPDLGVYAMGAGQLFVGDAKGHPCDEGRHSDFGTWVWIDHGGGVISRYGHLKTGTITVKAGTFVRAGQRIGTMGTTGKGSNCGVPYVDFQIRHGGAGGDRVKIHGLKVCTRAGVQSWPAGLNAADNWRQRKPRFELAPFLGGARTLHFSDWNDIPQRSVDFPATTGSCIDQGMPATPDRPAGARVVRSGSGALTVRWTPPASPRGVVAQIRLSQYHTSTHAWDFTQNEDVVTAAAGAGSVRFTGLLNGRPYRARVSYHAAAGWSRASAWHSLAPGAPPSRPTLRAPGLYVTKATKTVTVHFKWNPSNGKGASVSGYQVALRRVDKGHVGVWHTTRTKELFMTWKNLAKKGRYQVRVRAASPLGVSTYLTRTTR